jgi:hypothetical protein
MRSWSGGISMPVGSNHDSDAKELLIPISEKSEFK